MAPIDRSSGTAAFGADVASFYEELIVRMIVEPFADDLVKRLSTSRLGDLLELAVGKKPTDLVGEGATSSKSASQISVC